MPVDAAIEAEARAQAICMETEDFRRAYEAFAAKRQPAVRGQLAMAPRHPRVAVFRRRAPRVRAAAGAWVGATSGGPAAWRTRRRCRLPRSRRGAWRGSCGAGGSAEAARALDVRTLCLARETLAYRSGLGRFRVRHAGARQRSDLAVRLRRAEARAICRGSRAGAPSRRSRSPSPRRARTSRRWRTTAGATATGTCSTGRRRGSPTPASRTSTWSSREPARRRAQGALGLRGRCRHARPHGRRAHRGDRAAPARRRCASTACRVPAANCIGDAGEGFKSRWRRSTCSARRSAPRRWASRAARWTRRSRGSRRASCSAAPLAELQMTQADRRHGDRGRRGRAARLPRRLDQGSGAPPASRARRRWPRCSRPRRRSA